MSSMPPVNRLLTGKRGLKMFVYLFPVDHLEKGGDIVRASILIFQIIRMFPDVQSQNRDFTLADGAVLIG